MISVQIRFLARLREAVGKGGMTLTLETGTLAALREALSAQVDRSILERLFAENVRIAVNQTLWDGSTRFAQDDEVAFLPPVTGG
ncbi:MAG: MoaD/ThiS family protein [Gammaproteobacteria bacterium]|nr:MoaD/ThiS family protein [Gammaproteobacteria bacterium]